MRPICTIVQTPWLLFSVARRWVRQPQRQALLQPHIESEEQEEEAMGSAPSLGGISDWRVHPQAIPVNRIGSIDCDGVALLSESL
jgi:hypothetical protein